MGADPALLQLALQYDSGDMRYLSLSEMAQFRVTTDITSSASVAKKPTVPEAPPTTSPLGNPVEASGRFTIPELGRVWCDIRKGKLRLSRDQTLSQAP